MEADSGINLALTEFTLYIGVCGRAWKTPQEQVYIC